MTDKNFPAPSSSDMPDSHSPRILAAERLNTGLVIQFEDGQCAFFSDAFLFSKLPECEPLHEADVDW